MIQQCVRTFATMRRYVLMLLFAGVIGGVFMTLAAHTGFAATVAITSSKPSGTLPAGTTNSGIVVTTTVSATCRYALTEGMPYASMSNTMQVTGGTTHTTPLTNLEDGKSYTFFLRCQDITGIAMVTDYRVAFSVASTVTPPPTTPPIWDNPDPAVPTPTIPTTPTPTPTTTSPFVTPPQESDAADDDTWRIKMDFDGKRRTFKFTSRKTLYVRDREVTFYGTAPTIPNGVVVCEANDTERTTIAADGTWSLKVKLKDDKKHKVKIMYYNHSGTKVEEDTYTIRIDTDKPEITNLPSVLYKRPGDKVWWTAEDNDEIKQYKYEALGKIRKTDENFFYLPANTPRGTHMVRVRAYDRAGNKAVKDIRVIVR